MKLQQAYFRHKFSLHLQISHHLDKNDLGTYYQAILSTVVIGTVIKKTDVKAVGGIRTRNNWQ